MKCTVVVPSFNRLPTLIELLERLRRQDYPDFDVLVVDQSTRAAPEDVARLDAIAAESPLIRVERHPPLGVGGARNAGMASATGDVILFIDDDDLPAHDDWISRHMKNYADPDCVAVNGGEHRADGSRGAFESRFPRLAHRLAMSYSPFGTPMAFPGVRHRKEDCAFLRGGNASVRRRLAIEAGGWIDECGSGHEEHDFCFRLRKLMRPGQYIAFDPTAGMIRRLDIPGGAERRTGTLAREIESQVRFYFGVVRRHYPVRTAMLAPLYPAVIFGRAIGWILDDQAHAPAARKALALSKLAAGYPFLLARGMLRLAADPTGATTRPPTAPSPPRPTR